MPVRAARKKIVVAIGLIKNKLLSLQTIFGTLNNRINIIKNKYRYD